MSRTGFFIIFLVIKLATECQVSAFAIPPIQSAETVVDVGTISHIKQYSQPVKIVDIETDKKTENIQNLNTSNPINVVNVSQIEQTTQAIETKVTKYLTQPPTQTEEVKQDSVSQTITGILKKDEELTDVTQELNISVNTTPPQVISSTTTDNVIDNIFQTQTESSSTNPKLSISISESTDKIQVTTVNDVTSTQKPETVTVKKDATSVRNYESFSESVTTTTSLPQSTITSTESVRDVTTNKPLSIESSPNAQSVSEVTPYRKQYTTIERKRTQTVPESESTPTYTDMVRAHSAQTGITLEQVLGDTAITSIKKLKSEFLSITSEAPYSTITSDLSSLATETEPVTMPIREPADIFTTGKTTSLDIGMFKPENILTSQRGGYIDYSRPITSSETPLTETTTTDKATTETPSTTVTDSTLARHHTSDESNVAMASKSLLADDAMQEELMKERMIIENFANTRRNTVVYNVTRSSQTQSDVETTTQYTTASTSDDKLSVKPIVRTGLYTVNPNYKPLKKLEVQPSKPFLRNPDDNSWRNESLTSQGIVFKANNSSKTFTEVLKNKTETELNVISDKENKEAEENLKDKLKKIGDIRKSKKKKIGNSMYSDYEESNESSETTTHKAAPTISLTSLLSVKPKYIPESLTTVYGGIKTIKLTAIEESTTQMHRKEYVPNENFDDEDEDSDFITLPDIDIQKHITSLKTSKYPFPSLKTTPQPSQVPQFPERKPTIQYFPPRQPQRVNINDYDDGFKSKIKAFMENQEPKINTPVLKTLKNDQQNKSFLRVTQIDNKLKKSRYNIQNEPDTGIGNASPEGGYIIKHLKDFLNQASKGNYDRDAPYFMTDIPVRGITVNSDLTENLQNKLKRPEYDDYESEFRKDVLVKFVENFNQNSDRYKVDFPIVYNTSIVHSKDNAASRAYLKRGYEDTNVNKIRGGVKYDPNCDRTVELSPEYELHYFVPEQEEREVMETKSLPPPFKNYRIPG